MNILFTIDGVLRGDKQSVNREGLALYNALRQSNQMFLLADEPEACVLTWLKINGLGDFDVILDSDLQMPGETLREAQIRSAKARGGVSMLVDPDPAVIATVYDHGIVGLLFAAPQFAAPQYRPDAPRRVRSWSEIEKAVVQHRLDKGATQFVSDAVLTWDES